MSGNNSSGSSNGTQGSTDSSSHDDTTRADPRPSSSSSSSSRLVPNTLKPYSETASENGTGAAPLYESKDWTANKGS